VCRFTDIECSTEIGSSLNSSQIRKWKKNPYFGFKLSDVVYNFAKKYYKEEELTSDKKKIWPIYYRVKSTKKSLKRMYVKLKKNK
jgi:hypothetical protein